MMKIALIACYGGLPLALKEALCQQGHEVHVISFTEVPPNLQSDYMVSLGQIGNIFSYLSRHKISNMVLAGALSRPNLWKLRFDLTGLKLVWRLLTFLKKGDDALLRTICDFIQERSIRLWSIRDLCPEMMMPKGIISRRPLNNKIQRMISYGTEIITHLSPYDVGQSVVLSDQIVVALETLEGTDQMIRNVGLMDSKRLESLCQPLLVKMRKKNQSELVDLPTIGTDTIENLVRSGFVGAAIEANGCLILDIDAVIKAANAHNLVLVGFSND